MEEIQDKEQRSMRLENVKKGQLETLLLLNDSENSSGTNHRAFGAADLWKSWRLYLPVLREISSVKFTQWYVSGTTDLSYSCRYIYNALLLPS